MSGRVCGLAVALAIGVSGACAGDLARHARFVALTGHDDGFEVAREQGRGGLTITGEKILLENGNLTATVQKVGHHDFSMAGVAASGRVPLDDAFFADPITAAVNDLLDGSKVSIAEFKNLVPVPDVPELVVKDVQITMAAKAVSGSAKAFVFKPEFKGHASYDKTTKKMTITLESVTMGGNAVPIDLTFYVLGQALPYSYVTLAKPNVIVDLAPFLPNVGGSLRLP